MSFLQKKSEDPTEAAQANNSVEGESSDVLVENLYKKNIELLVKNKTLSLLSKLYEMSILTLEPKDLALRVSQAVQADLNFELVGIFIFKAESDSLEPLAISKSERVNQTLEKLKLSLDEKQIPLVSKRDFFQKAVGLKEENMTSNIDGAWGDVVDHEKLQAMAAESNIKTTLLYPLLVESKVLGTILLSLNRSYETLNSFEKESVKSFVNMIALALQKAFLYQDLQIANAQLRELDRQKDELISIVSHQLATPITSIKWYLEMMMGGDLGKLTTEMEEHVKSMQSIAMNLVDLVGMILDVSRIQLGRMKIERQKLDLSMFFKEILEEVTPKAVERKINFVKQMPESFPEAMLDKRYTRMTVENLLTNAVKYTPEQGNVTLKVEIKDNILHCTVSDTGYGIPKEDQVKIFGKMFRAGNVRNSVDGNGFGLYVAKGAIEAQGGKIWFESTEGKGTTFFIELPLLDENIAK